MTLPFKLRHFVIWCLTACLLVLLFLLSYLYSPWWPNDETEIDNPVRIVSIPLPEGYERKYDDSYADYLRNLPLMPTDSVVRTFDGDTSRRAQPFCYRVIDKPIISQYEQCADVCIHLRADYLYSQRRFFSIHFDDTQYHTMRYWRGARHWWYEKYLREVFGLANSQSMVQEMPQRKLEDLHVGDVFVYDSESREDSNLGHAILVADLAENKDTGSKIVLLVQGSTPACSMHILRNQSDSILSPWFLLDETADTLDFGYARYGREELRYWP